MSPAFPLRLGELCANLFRIDTEMVGKPLRVLAR
jgi:hypothetical protein